MRTRIPFQGTHNSSAARKPSSQQAANSTYIPPTTDEQMLRRMIQRASPEMTNPDPSDALALQRYLGNQAAMRVMKSGAASRASGANRTAAGAAPTASGMAGGKNAEPFLEQLAVKQQGSGQSQQEDEAANVQTKSLLQRYFAGGKSDLDDEVRAFSQQNSAGDIAAARGRLLGGSVRSDQAGVLRRDGDGTSATSTFTPAPAAGVTPPSPPPPTSLTKTTVAGPTGSASGGWDWTVQWKLSNPSPAGGWVIQRVNVSGTVTGSGGNVATGWESYVPYWEAWKINAGKTITTYAEGGDVMDDTFSNPGYSADTKGNLTEAGTAVFYEGQALPSSFSVRTGHPAGILPVATADPGLSGGTSPLTHNLTARWDPAGGSTATTITTV